MDVHSAKREPLTAVAQALPAGWSGSAERVLARLSASIGLGVMIAGFLLLCGWAFDIRVLKSVSPTLVEIKATTAVAFMLGGASLWLLVPPGGARISRQAARLARALAALVGILALLNLGEYAFGWSPGIGQWLFDDARAPGRMAVMTAGNFALLAAALLLLGVETRAGRRPGNWLALAIAANSFVVLLGYLYRIGELYRPFGSDAMGLHTAILFPLLSIGLVCARPAGHFLQVLLGDSAAGQLRRRLLPAALLVPTALGWLRLQGQAAGYYSLNFGVAIVTISSIAIFLVLIWWNANRLEQESRARQRAEVEIRTLNAELEQRVAQRTVELETANKGLEGFSYSVSHDLRAPLRAIDSFSNILLEDYSATLDAEGQRLLRTVRRNTEKMEGLIQDILAFSRAGRRDLVLTDVDVTSLCRQIVGELLATVPGRRIAVRIGELPRARADAAMLRQALVNLLSNAVKFTGTREQAEIDITGAATADQVTYSIRDNGVGFNPDYLHKLFGVFQRLHSDSEFPGTGIGLAIVKRVIDKLGGRVWAEGQVDHGATFHICLPRSPATTASGAPP